MASVASCWVMRVVLNCQSMVLAAERVVERLHGVPPEDLGRHGVRVVMPCFQVKQAFEVATGVPRSDFTSQTLKVAGPCPACVERQQQLLDRPHAQERLVKHWDQIKVQHEDPSWLQEEAVRLAAEADRIERGQGHRDEFAWVPDPAPADENTRADDEPHRVLPLLLGAAGA